LQTLFSNLNSADYRKANIEIKALLKFMTSQPDLSEIVDGLPTNKVDIEQWSNEVWHQANYEMPEDEQERAAFCLAVLELYRDDPTQIAFKFQISSSGVTDHVREYIDTIARPLYQYLDQAMHEKELQATPISEMQVTANNFVMIQGNNYGTISQTNNDAIQLLGQLAEAINKSQIETDKKLEAIANIDTIKAQLSSSKPSKEILRLAWQTVNAAAVIAGATSFAQQIIHLVPLLK
jgi:hypothetical protein